MRDECLAMYNSLVDVPPVIDSCLMQYVNTDPFEGMEKITSDKEVDAA